MFGAIAAGLYSDVAETQQKMSSGFSKTYISQPDRAKEYQGLY